ncbi:MAG TPA: MaoC/PaaZ C-terminal domain-containing protein [Candidatus Dormibacteraeota bacterium]|nr:MaoC/PaaZ C-terminal domain-containing protein [Candidatus Dormibacteraeota bacterium]
MNPASDASFGIFLGSHCYSLSKQRAFALLSGDHNPNHVDPVEARRTLTGALTVHGMHLAFCALEAALKYLEKVAKNELRLGGMQAFFHKPVLVGDVVQIYLTEKSAEKCQVVCLVGEERVHQVTLHFPPGSISKGKSIPPPLPNEPLRSATFYELKSANGHMPIGLDRSAASKLFPRSIKSLGNARMAELLALTRLVGMRCPGLHSLFSQFDVSWTSGNGPWLLHYRVAKSDERFRRLQIEVSTGRLKGNLNVFVRPAPVQQSSTSTIKTRVSAGSFSASRALIIGGSRGLGEITAKIIAAGGGHPIITYFSGAKDAQTVAKDIRDSGGNCSLLRMNVKKEGSAAFLRLLKSSGAPRSIYYFATPKIFGPRRAFFDCEKFQDFQDYYITGFVRLIQTIASATTGLLHVFYPSSVAVQENRRELAEYSIAKQTAESVCAFYNQHSDRIKIVVERLPRTRTDQTGTLMPIPADEPLDVMLPFVERIEHLVSKSRT